MNGYTSFFPDATNYSVEGSYFAPAGSNGGGGGGGNVPNGTITGQSIAWDASAGVWDLMGEAAQGVFIGQNTGTCPQGVAIGPDANSINQGIGGVFIGQSAGIYTQSNNCVAIGFNAGFSNQATSAIAVGNFAGYQQGPGAISIGSGAGSNQNGASIAIGVNCGLSQTVDCIAMGENAGLTQAANAIALGVNCGSNQSTNCIAIGNGAGSNQGSNSIAIGQTANTPYVGSVAIGTSAGISQGTLSVNIGANSGTGIATNMGSYTVAVGYNSQDDGAADYALALGSGAGSSGAGTPQNSNSICINATANVLPDAGANTLVVKPIRNASQTNSLFYNTTSGEVTYNAVGASIPTSVGTFGTAAGGTLSYSGTCILAATGGPFYQSAFTVPAGYTGTNSICLITSQLLVGVVCYTPQYSIVGTTITISMGTIPNTVLGIDAIVSYQFVSIVAP